MNDANLTLGEIATRTRALQKEFSDSIVTGLDISAYSFDGSEKLAFRVIRTHGSHYTVGTGKTFAEAEVDLRKQMQPESLLSKAQRLEDEARRLREQAAIKQVTKPLEP